jgi:hypothetical protein
VAGQVGGGAHPLVIGFVVAVIAVAEIEPSDIHSGLDQRLNRVVACGGRAKRTDDLSASIHV